VVEARRILSFFEHLTEEQRPPKSIWHSAKKCARYIEDHAPGKEGGGSSAMYFDSDREVERAT